MFSVQIKLNSITHFSYKWCGKTKINRVS